MSGSYGYRADIDGLRSLAVLPVVFYHANLAGFSGGFVGVDVFFVISGFLITGILLNAIANDRFSILDFYERRIRRIFPALLLVLATTAAVAWVVFTPERLTAFGTSLASVSIFGSNFHFWKAVDYFSNKAHIQPLLHTWSLAVEEQFYIFYPILLFLVARMGLALRPILMAIALLSFAGAAVFVTRTPGAVFYLLPFRAWELIIGGLLATGWPTVRLTERQALWTTGTGMALIAASVFFYTASTPFPGLAAVPPTLGAAMIIWGGTHHVTAGQKLLSHPLIVLIGKASYSLYLWHFPVFAFAIYLLNRTLDPLTGVALSLLCLGLSLATLRWIETPVRLSKRRLAVYVPVILMVIAGVGGLILARSDGFPQRLPAAARTIAETANDKTRHPEECMSNGDVIVTPDRFCRLGDLSGPGETLLWGDSHAMVTATAMEVAARKAGRLFLFAAAADCPPGLGFAISPDFQPGLTRTPSYRFCGDYNRQMYTLATSAPGIKTVVLSARWSNWRIGEPSNTIEDTVDIRLTDADGVASSVKDNARIFETGFTRLVRALSAAGKQVYIVGPVPEPAFDVPQTLFVARFGLAHPETAIPLAAFQARHKHALAIIRRAMAGTSARLILPHEVLCSPTGCPLSVNGVPVYFDHNHLSVDAARRTSPLYQGIFADPKERAADGQ